MTNKKIQISLLALLTTLPGIAYSEIEINSKDGKYSAIFSGSLTGYYGVLNQQKLFGYTDAGNQDTRSLENKNSLAMSSDLSVKLESKIDEANKYGVFLKLNTNPSPTSSGKIYVADKTMFYFESTKWGRVEIGTYNGAHDRIKVTPSNFAAGTGGPDGDYGLWIRQGAFSTIKEGEDISYYNATNLFYTDINLPGASSQTRANKITLYPISIHGFSSGISFVPDTDVYGTIFRSVGEGGDKAPEVYRQGYGYRNVFEGGFKYEGKVNQIDYAISIMGEVGKAKDIVTLVGEKRDIRDTIKRYDLAAYEIGSSVTFNGLTLSAAYADLGKSGGIKKIVDKDGQDVKDYTKLVKVKPKSSYYSLGASYSYDKAKVSLTYYNSNALLKPALYNDNAKILEIDADAKTNNFNMISAGVDYKILDNVTVFAEYNYFKYSKKDGDTYKAYSEDNKKADSFGVNKGSVVFVGLKAKF